MTTQTIPPELLKLYAQFRKDKPFMLVSHDAKCSLDAAKTLLRFRELESQGLVRMRCEPEEESYFDVYVEPELEYRNGHPITQEETNRNLERLLELHGVWWTAAEWRPNTETDDWEMADSCGMHAGYKDPLSPFENCYVIQEMQSAIDAYEKHIADTQTEENESFAMACRDVATLRLKHQ